MEGKDLPSHLVEKHPHQHLGGGRGGGKFLKEGPQLEGGWLLLYLCFLLSLLTPPGLLTQSLFSQRSSRPW